MIALWLSCHPMTSPVAALFTATSNNRFYEKIEEE